MGIIFQYRCGIVRMEAIPTLMEELTHSKFEILQSAFLESVLAKLQSCQSSHSKYKRKNPKADDDLVLMPALELKVVVDGRHTENAFTTTQFKGTYLKYH